MGKALPFAIVSAILLGSCGLTATRPKLEMALARSAFLAAKQANAPQHAPGVFRQAQTYYLKAKSSYRRKYFNKAKQYATISRKFSERAEYYSVKKKTLDE